MSLPVNQSELVLIQGDITESDSEAIVNAANSELILGAGVSGAIRKKGGPQIQQELDGMDGCPTGEAVVTSGGALSARYVIHAVGPRGGGGDEENKLLSATLNSLKRAEEKGVRSIAFPALSTGIFGFPMDLAGKIMIQAVRGYLSADTGI